MFGWPCVFGQTCGFAVRLCVYKQNSTLRSCIHFVGLQCLSIMLPSSLCLNNQGHSSDWTQSKIVAQRLEVAWLARTYFTLAAKRPALPSSCKLYLTSNLNNLDVLFCFVRASHTSFLLCVYPTYNHTHTHTHTHTLTHTHTHTHSSDQPCMQLSYEQPWSPGCPLLA